MHLTLASGFTVTDIFDHDGAAYVQHLREKQIYDQTLRIPYPYSEADAQGWIDLNKAETKRQGRSTNWAIRDINGFLVGGIGFGGLEFGQSHGAELGYWLAKPYWSRGIMTEAVHAVTVFAFTELRLVRVQAHVFDFNRGSARVLEKAGYNLEGRLRNFYCKDDRIFDALLYAQILSR